MNSIQRAEIGIEGSMGWIMGFLSPMHFISEEVGQDVADSCDGHRTIAP